MMAVFGGSVGHGAGDRPDQAAGMPPADQMLPVEYAAMGALLLAQFAPIALAVLVITAEYASGSIWSTLLWDPRRGRVLLAKAVVLAVVMLVAGTAVAALAAVAADLLAGEKAEKTLNARNPANINAGRSLPSGRRIGDTMA